MLTGSRPLVTTIIVFNKYKRLNVIQGLVGQPLKSSSVRIRVSSYANESNVEDMLRSYNVKIYYASILVWT